MHANKLLLVAMASLLLGACAAAKEAAMNFESKLLITDKPRIGDVTAGIDLNNSERPRYSDLYEMEVKYPGGLVNMKEVQKHLDDTLREVSTVAGFPDFHGKVYVLSDPNSLHAQASREGNIFITLGFLRNLKSQEELTNLIAHEFAHVALQHHKSDVFKDLNSRVVVALNALTKFSAIATSLQEDNDKATNRQIEKGVDLIDKARFVQDLVAQVATPTWGRQQELEADQFAADVSVRLKHRYSKSYLWMARLSKIEDSGNFKNIQANYVNLRYIEQAAEFGKTADDKSKDVGDRTEGFLLKLAYMGVISAIDYFSSTHSDPKFRIRAVKQYYSKVHPDAASDNFQNDPWSKVSASSDLQTTAEAYLLADEAVALASERSKRKQALATMKKAESMRPKGHVYIWSRKVEMYEMLNDKRNMQASLDKGPTAGLISIVPNVSARIQLNNLMVTTLPAADPLNSGNVTQQPLSEEEKRERLAAIRELQNQVALPVYDLKNERRLPNVRMLLLKSDLLMLAGQKTKAKDLQQEIFETFQRPGFIYPRLITTVGSDKDSEFSRLEAERLNLECGFMYPEQAAVCQNALNSLNKSS